MTSTQDPKKLALSAIEEWRPIEGFSKYEVSNFGRVRSFAMKNCSSVRILRPIGDRKGYLRHSLFYKTGKMKSKSVASLVLEAFVCKRPPNNDACHNDGNPQNNNLSNLRWDTRKGNLSDRKIHGTILHGEKHNCAKLTWANVRYIRKNYSKELNLHLKFSVSKTTIQDIVKGRSWIEQILNPTGDNKGE